MKIVKKGLYQILIFGHSSEFSMVKNINKYKNNKKIEDELVMRF